jgi:copper homeostasis protein
MQQRRPLLEVIVCSVEDAVAAARGGADRLEVISRFDVGGLTPSIEMVEEIVMAVPIPARVMLRESANFTIADVGERKRLEQAARAFAQLPVDGLVLGFLRGEEIDEDSLAELLACAPHLSATFHRAFEEVPAPARAIETLKRHPQIDRILTNGSPGDLTERIARLALCARVAGPEIQILAGGGMTVEVIRSIRAAAEIGEFHVGSLVRRDERIDGNVETARVRALIELLEAGG